MPFGLGSRSAQTPSESSQQAQSNQYVAGAGGNDAAAVKVAGWIAALPAGNYKVCHKWRKVGDDYVKGTPHHSQIFVTDLNDKVLFNFGLFSNSSGKVIFDDDKDRPTNPYKPSSSYSPNPLTVSQTALANAFTSVRAKCGADYKLLHNNCQKFGRLLMQALGAKHNRHLFHP